MPYVIIFLRIGGSSMVLIESLTKIDFVEDVKHEYFYRMFKNEFSVDREGRKVGIQSYGIEVERQDIKEGQIVNIEREYVKNISPQRHKVHNMMKMLYDNLVSPIHLVDILGESIDYLIADFDDLINEAAY